MKKFFSIVSVLLFTVFLAACAAGTPAQNNADASGQSRTGGISADTAVQEQAALPEDIAVYDTADATRFVFSDDAIEATEGAYDGYKVEGTALSIKDGGTYVVSGSCRNGTIVVKKGVTGVVLVLDGLTLSASATAPITCNKASGVTIVAAEGSVNYLEDDEYNNDDVYTDEELYPDIENAVIKCKDGSNVTIGGTGTICVTAHGKNGVKGGYDLYQEDEDGNVTDTLLSAASLTVQNVTLQITATVNDGLKADKELNLLSGNITVSAADDGIKSDYVLNIGAEGKQGPTIDVTQANEGIEAATLRVYSGVVRVNATNDGINAANSDLNGYAFSYEQYGGYVYVNVTGGDGIDSNGTIRLAGGTLEVYAPAQGDGDPLDADKGTSLEGATVLAVGHLGMPQGYTAQTPYVTFGGTGGKGGMGGGQSNLVTAGSTIQITDAAGNVLYSATALRNAGYVLFADPQLAAGAAYTLKNGDSAAATATAGTSSATGMGKGGQRSGGDAFDPFGQDQPGGSGDSGGMRPGGPRQGGTPPEKPAGQQPGSSDGGDPPESPDGEVPPEPPEGETVPGEKPDGDSAV